MPLPITLAAKNQNGKAGTVEITQAMIDACIAGCRSRDLSFETLARHLKRQQWQSKTSSAAAGGQFLPVELAVGKLPAELPTERDASCALAVVSSGGRRIEVQPGFDEHTLERLVSAPEHL